VTGHTNEKPSKWEGFFVKSLKLLVIDYLIAKEKVDSRITECSRQIRHFMCNPDAGLNGSFNPCWYG
jgi:hypothetical protein